MRVSVNDRIPFSAPSPAVGRDSTSPRGDSSSFANVLQGLGRELDGGEQTMHAAMGAMGSGADMTPGQLIALQARVYRYSEAIDLASRLVDRSTASIKTVLQGSNT